MLSAKPAPLAAVAETRETSSHGRGDSLADNYSREPSSVDSDYRADIFEDKNVETAVESFQEDTSPDAHSASRSDRDSSASSSELQRLEDALHGRVPVGAFPPRLRINKLTLTPKQSMQQLLVVKSGDGSFVLKSTISKSLKVRTSRSDATADLNTLPAFEKSQLDWNFCGNIPMQISTVGYAFPEYHTAYCGPNSAIRSLDNIFKLGLSVSSTCTKGNKKSDKMSQCFKGSQSKHDAQDTVYPLNNEDVMPVSRKKQTNSASVATDAPTFTNIEKTCGDCTKMLKDKCQTKAEEPKVKGNVEAEELKVKGNVENVDCTSSLDMLVGLLNEIQKITTCHITDTVQYADKRGCGEFQDVVNGKAALKDTAININSHELVSIASLDKLRQLESSPSIYSLYLSDGDKESIEEKIGLPVLPKSIKSVLCNEIPSHVDKEVGADFPVREYATAFTDVPSAIFPITVTHGTNVSNSLIGVLSKPSSQSLVSLEEFHSAYSNPTFNCKKKVIEITEECKIREIFEEPVSVSPKNEKKLETSGEVVIENTIIATEVHKVTTHVNLLGHQTKLYRKSSDFDPLFKMKRDILVTMYSMLVLTVFAALSFPEILYHV